MRPSDVILGLLIIFLVGYVVLLAVNQGNIYAAIADLYTRQVYSQTLINPETLCPKYLDFVLVKKENIEFDDYRIMPGQNPDTNQLFFCFYKEKTIT